MSVRAGKVFSSCHDESGYLHFVYLFGSVDGIVVPVLSSTVDVLYTLVSVPPVLPDTLKHDGAVITHLLSV